MTNLTPELATYLLVFYKHKQVEYQSSFQYDSIRCNFLHRSLVISEEVLFWTGFFFLLEQCLCMYITKELKRFSSSQGKKIKDLTNLSLIYRQILSNRWGITEKSNINIINEMTQIKIKTHGEEMISHYNGY